MAEQAEQAETGGHIGVRRKRVEDAPLLTRSGAYTSDLRFERMAELAIVRSPHPHARILAIDVTPALAVRGVLAAFAGRDLPEIMKPLPGGTRAPDAHIVTPTPLARDVVRFAGEPVVVVVAEDRYSAEDGVADHKPCVGRSLIALIGCVL